MNKKPQRSRGAQQPSSKTIRNAKARARKKERTKIMRSIDPRFAFGWSGGNIPTPWGNVSPGNIQLQTDSFAERMGGGKGPSGKKGRSISKFDRFKEDLICDDDYCSDKIGLDLAGRSARSSGMVGLGQYTDDIQVVLPRVFPTKNQKGEAIDLCVGTEFLSSISNETLGAAPGDLLATLLINPSNFTQTRLVEFAKLYQRYRFRKLHFWYKPIANSIQSGQLIGFGDYDPDNIVVLNSPDNISLAAAHLGQATGKIWETIKFPFGVVDDYTTLFVDTNSSEKRLSYQGVYYLLAASDIESTIGPLGNLYIDYEIEFSIPLLQPTSQQLTAAVIDSGTSLTTTNPMGTDPGISGAISIPTSLSFSEEDEEADLFWDPSIAQGVLRNNATNDGDVWLYGCDLMINQNSQTIPLGSNITVTPTWDFTNSTVQDLNINPNAGKQQVTITTSTVAQAAYDVTWWKLVRVTNGLAVESKFQFTTLPVLPGGWTVGGMRFYLQRLYRGAATPALNASIPRQFSLDFLRRKEARKRAMMKVLRDEKEAYKRYKHAESSYRGGFLSIQSEEYDGSNPSQCPRESTTTEPNWRKFARG